VTARATSAQISASKAVVLVVPASYASPANLIGTLFGRGGDHCGSGSWSPRRL